MKKIGILFICTGEYWKFWDNFYKSCEENFLIDEEKHYFIFTDSEELLKIKDKRLHPIFQEKMDWPFPTLYRYKIFMKNKDYFNDMDYLIFCNANLFFSEVNVIHLFSFPYGNTNSYAIVFNTVEGLITSVFIMLVLINFCIKKNIDYIAYKFIGLTFIFWLLFAISIGFFQSRYLIFGDYLLIFSYIFLKSNRRRYR